MTIQKLQRFAAATSAALLVISAMVPLDAKSQQSPRARRGLAPALIPYPELIFEPIQPCRAIATGASNGGGAIPANTARSFYVSGTTGFDTQGGNSGGCGVPASATAVAISLTALATPNGGSGKVIAYPYGNSVPSTVALSFAPNIAQTSNVIVGVNQSQISLQTKISSVQLNGDITGYFAPQIQVSVASDGSTVASTSRIVGVTRTSAGHYQIAVDRDISYCAYHVTASIYSGPAIANADFVGASNEVEVRIYRASNGTFIAMDGSFSFSVLC